MSGRNVGVSQSNTIIVVYYCGGHSKRKTLMMSTYNMTTANPAMAPGGMAGLLSLDPPLCAAACAEGVSPFINDDKFSVIKDSFNDDNTKILVLTCYY